VIDDSYYYPNSFQPGISQNKTAGRHGQVNAVDMLYSSEGITPYNSTDSDPYRIITTTQAESLAGQQNFTQEIPILLPEGIHPVFSQDAGSIITMCVASDDVECLWKYRALVRSYITKLPGFFFTAFKQVAALELVTVISYPQMEQMLKDFNSTTSTDWNATVDGQNYTYNIPKKKLLVKYAANITQDRRDFIINGIRSTFPQTYWAPILVDVISIIESLQTINHVFTFIVGVIGLISLILTFFLLLVATTQNIKDNIWEYGVLRSMGITKEQGRRIFMYEAFLVICAAGTLGIMIGVCVASLTTAQFNLFLE
jgi:ABC-type antimicrobial peptide transport system permease subunit